MKPQVICVDLDGVLVDLHHALVRYLAMIPRSIRNRIGRRSESGDYRYRRVIFGERFVPRDISGG